MIFKISDDDILELDQLEEIQLEEEGEDSSKYICLFTGEDSLEALETFGFSPSPMDEAYDSATMIFESHDSFDFLSINLPVMQTNLYGSEKVIIYHSKDSLIFHANQEASFNEIYNIIFTLKSKYQSQKELYDSTHLMNRILYSFLEKMTIFSMDLMDEFEIKVYELETSLIESVNSDYVEDIIMLRKDLFGLKKHYQQLLDIMDELQENENQFMDEKTLKLLKIFDSKVSRHYNHILSLRDYVTQIREAYQAQLDIEQNQIMKIFTVITAIFLPLTLIVGWYGMNLQMPEFQFPYTYPIVIVASLLIVILSVFYFKRKNWI